MKHRTLQNLIVFAVAGLCAVASAFGIPILSPEAVAGLALIGVAGEIEGVEVKELQGLIQRQNEAWGEMMRKNDALLAAKADGKAVGDLQASIATLQTEFKSINDTVVELAKAGARRLIEGGKASLTEAQLEYKDALNRWIRKGDDTGLLDLQKKAYNSGSNPDGGYLIMPEMDSEMTRVVGVVSALGSVIRQQTIGTSTYKKIVKTTGMTARRVGEGATGGETTNPKWAELEFVAHTAEAEPHIFNETLDDAIINLEADLANEAAIAFAELTANEYVNGTGVGQARGILGYTAIANASYTWGKVGYIATGVSGDWAAANKGDKIIDLQHALKAQYRSGASFLMGDATLATVRQMKDGSGAYYLWQPDPLAGFGGRLLGSPVLIDDNMPVIAANSHSVAYGNWAQAYVGVNRMGTILIRDNLTTKGRTKFNFRRRFGGGVQNFEAYKTLKFGTS